jgi:hypothetical protein
VEERQEREARHEGEAASLPEEAVRDDPAAQADSAMRDDLGGFRQYCHLDHLLPLQARP